MWAPWRLEYIINSGSDGGCIFCEKPKEKNDEKNFIIYRGKESFALLNIYPYNNGHIMIAPYRHTGSLDDLSTETLCEMMELVKKITHRIKKEMKAQGFNVGINVGKAAGAGIEQHIHIHVVPRWPGDTNFMPVVCGTKIISESLKSVYDKLKF